ncbi:hypothetical protein GCM10027049_01600 [Mucilaginibacter puniceus]
MIFLKPLSTIALLAIALTSQAQTKTGLHIIKKLPMGGSGGWDYLTVDGPGNRIYVSHNSRVHVLTITGDSVGTISNTTGVHGIALAKPFGKGYTSNGRSNNSTVFDLKTNKVITTIQTGANPDAIFYDEFSKKVYAFNGNSKDATVIDPATDKVVATIPLGGKPETGVSDGKGNIFVNSETTNEVIVINANTYQVIHRYKIELGDEPTGLAIDLATNRLFIGCGGSKTLVVMDAANGKNLAKFPIEDCDGVAFDPASKQAFVSNRTGTMSVIKELSADKFEFVENVTTEAGARTIAIDPATHLLYLPTATANAFHVIVVGK